MLRSMQDLQDYEIGATDGAIGNVKDFYFDDAAWVIRYLVVDTGAWLPGRKVLISPMAIGPPDWDEKLLPVSITKEQVKNSPDIDTDKPVTRQHEVQYLEYYRYPYYWGGTGIWGASSYPGMMLTGVGYGGSEAAYRAAQAQDARAAECAERDRAHADPHLRSCKAIIGYNINATDGDIGHVKSLLVDEETWAIRYTVVETGSWWAGHQVLIAPEWIKDVRWADQTVSVDLTRQAVKDAPAYESTEQLNREREVSLYDHYRRPGYWAAQSPR